MPKDTKPPGKTAPKRKYDWLFWPVIILIVLAAIVVGGGSFANRHLFHQADIQADTRADNAAVYMNDRTGVETSTSDLAYKVVGTIGQPAALQIEALEASGTNFNGTVVLRISAIVQSGTFNESDALNCYQYQFKKYQPVVETKLKTCPNKPALQLPEPVISNYNPKTAP